MFPVSEFVGGGKTTFRYVYVQALSLSIFVSTFSVHSRKLASSLQAAKNVGERARRMTTVVEEAAWISYSEAQKYTGLGRTKL